MDDVGLAYQQLLRQTGDLDLQRLIQHKISLEKMLGNRWIDREINLAKKRGGRPEDMHPLLFLIAHCAHWFEQTRSSGLVNPTPTILDLMRLGDLLVRVKQAKGQEPRLEKLKDEREFESTVFEIETAVAHLNVGNEVEFIEETTASNGPKSPDLRVCSPQHIFFVECKSKELKHITSWEPVEKYVKRLVKTASTQLNLGGPGFLWIKFPYALSLEEGHKHLQELRNRIQYNLRPTDSRNVTRIYLILPCYTTITDGIREGRGYYTYQGVVEHLNPRYPLPR